MCLTSGLWQLKIAIIPVLSYLELLKIYKFHTGGPFPIKRDIYSDEIPNILQRGTMDSIIDDQCLLASLSIFMGRIHAKKVFT